MVTRTIQRTRHGALHKHVVSGMCLRVWLVAKEEAPAPLQFVAANIAANVFSQPHHIA